MLDKIGTAGFEQISKPDTRVLEFLDLVLENEPNPVVYEIGVGIGATTLEIAKKLDNRGELYLFSRDRCVKELAGDLVERGYTNVNADWGSGPAIYSGYHFELAQGFVSGQLPPFHLAYLDGGHVMHLDGAAAAVLKELCRPNGYLLLDDYKWSLASSPSMKPEVRPATREEYDDKQIEASHVELVCKAIIDTDERFEPLGVRFNTAVYRRRRR